MRKSLDGGPLHAMRAFVRVVDAGSFTAAADQMQLTVAQVSRLVSDLEKRLQVKLLMRSTRKSALSEAGSIYIEKCREILALVDEAESSVLDTVASPRGRFRIQCMANFGQHYVSPVLAEFCASHPDLTVQYSTSQYVPDLLAKGVDVSIYLSEALLDSGLIAKRIGTSFAVVCASPSYIEQNGIVANPVELSERACLRLVNPSIASEWHLTTKRGKSIGLTPPTRLVADTPDVLVEAATRGAGIALLPLFSVIDEIRSGALERLLPEWRSPDIGVYTLMPSRQFVDAKTRAWLDFVQSKICPQLDEDAAFFT